MERTVNSSGSGMVPKTFVGFAVLAPKHAMWLGQGWGLEAVISAGQGHLIKVATIGNWSTPQHMSYQIVETPANCKSSTAVILWVVSRRLGRTSFWASRSYVAALSPHTHIMLLPPLLACRSVLGSLATDRMHHSQIGKWWYHFDYNIWKQHVGHGKFWFQHIN